jgi:hypothetical protein
LAGSAGLYAVVLLIVVRPVVQDRIPLSPL